MKNYYFDIDGVLANFHKEPFDFKKASSHDWIANLDPFMENVKTVRSLIMKGENVYICSKAINNDAKQGKIDWLKKFIPEMKAENIIIIVGSGRKVDFIRTETAILVDDDMKNIRPWVKAGYDYIYVEHKGEAIAI
jgi:5'(3')-deoxyribonucleotidase